MKTNVRLMAAIWIAFQAVPASAGDPYAHFEKTSFEDLSRGPWRSVPVQGKDFWFTLGGDDENAVLSKTLDAKQIADHGLQSCGVGEWEYSFHHIPPGEKDGAGYVHHGGYPTPPQSRQEAANVVRDYYLKLVADAKAKATPEQQKLFASFNGHHCYQHYACEWGCDLVGSEVGENINSIQMHIAFTRGAARQYGKPWMIDFSSWYGPSIYDENPKKTWGDYSGADYGHSISLHQRTYCLAYMAGANAVIAEAGNLNFFQSQEPGPDGMLPLSKLGEAGAQFYQFTKRMPDRGVPYTPFALLVDHYHGIDPGFGKKLAWNAFPYTNGDQRILDIWNLFFPGSIDVQSHHDEKGYLVASPYGDVLDVITTHASDAVLASYPVLLLAGELTDPDGLAPRLREYVKRGGILVISADDAGRQSFLKELGTSKITDIGYQARRLGRGRVITYKEPQNDNSSVPLAAVVGELCDEIIPFTISGQVETLFNRTTSGWVLTVINNEGIAKAFKEKPVIDEARTQSVRIQYRGKQKIVDALLMKLNRDEPIAINSREFKIAPGEVGFAAFALR